MSESIMCQAEARRSRGRDDRHEDLDDPSGAVVRPPIAGPVEAMARVIAMAVEAEVFALWCEQGWRDHEIDTTSAVSILRSHGITDEVLASAGGRVAVVETHHPDSPEEIVVREVIVPWFRCRFNERPWYLQEELIRLGWHHGVFVEFWAHHPDVLALGIRAELWKSDSWPTPQWRWTIVPKPEIESEVAL